MTKRIYPWERTCQFIGTLQRKGREIMDEFARLLQRQLTVGSNVKIILKSGQETIGLLTEIGSRYITLEKRGGRPTTLMIDVIGGWEVLDGDAPELATASSPQNVVTPLVGAMFE